MRVARYAIYEKTTAVRYQVETAYPSTYLHRDISTIGCAPSLKVLTDKILREALLAMEFSDKVIIVTGASSGIGRTTALAFAQHGCFLTITGRNVEHLDAVAVLCKTEGAKDVLTVVAEFENLTEVEMVVTKTVEKFKTIHVLVNNAGMAVWSTLEHVKMEDFDRLFHVNVKSTVRITQQAIPYLVETRGNVVNVSSNLAGMQVTDLLVYGMTKAAMNQFTKTIALEYAPKGVRVNAICPSVVRTDVRRDRPHDEDIEAFHASIASALPLGRVGEVEDCTNAILFLASNRSAWTTGICMILDGGANLR